MSDTSSPSDYIPSGYVITEKLHYLLPDDRDFSFLACDKRMQKAHKKVNSLYGFSPSARHKKDKICGIIIQYLKR